MCACGQWVPEREREATVEKIPTLQAKGNTEAKFVILN